MAAVLTRRTSLPVLISVAALVVMVALASAPLARGEECSLAEVRLKCITEAELTTDPNKDKMLSDECCNYFAKRKACLCKLRTVLADKGVDPKKPLCSYDAGCPDV